MSFIPRARALTPLALDLRSIGLWIASSLITWKSFDFAELAQEGSRVAIDFDAAMPAGALLSASALSLEETADG